MKKFLGRVLAVFVGIILFNVLILIFLGILAGSQSKQVTIKDNSLLMLELNGEINELGEENPFGDIDFPGFDDMESLGLVDIKEAIRDAKTDPKIKGIYLKIENPQAGGATFYEIRKALEDFKTSGKYILAYGSSYGQGTYYLASVADRVFCNPTGNIFFGGFSSEMPYFKGTLEKLEITPMVFRVGEFKSAVEPFIRENMSDEARLQTETFLNGALSYILSEISASRNISPERLRTISDSLLVRKPQDALAFGMIDGVLYKDQLIDTLYARLGIKKKNKKEDDEEELPLVTVGKYLKSDRSHVKTPKEKDKIAVIVAEGQIMDQGGKDDIVGEKMAAEIRAAREDDKVKAIVLRVNSPGGSASASDVMWREVYLCSQVKPIIASMGDVAASGGYYMSMAADTIVASPLTITGSIGVFGLLFEMEAAAKNKLGVTFDRVSTGKFGSLMSPFKKMNEAEKAIIQTEVESIYDTFTTKAAMGRNVSVEDIKAVGGGRVWIGTDAKEKKLVDKMGTLEDAIAIAAKKARLEEGKYRVSYRPEKKNFIEELKSGFSSSILTKLFFNAETNEIKEISQEITRLGRYQGIQAWSPYRIRFE